MIFRTASVLTVVLLTGCSDAGRGSDAVDRAANTGAPLRPASEDEWFADRAEETGLDFVHFNGASGDFYYPEILPPGVGLLDYDNDGDLDVYLVQGGRLGAGKDPLIPPHGPLPLKGRLYRNDLQVRPDGTRTLRFTDV